jgi:hypothetical protein
MSSSSSNCQKPVYRHQASCNSNSLLDNRQATSSSSSSSSQALLRRDEASCHSRIPLADSQALLDSLVPLHSDQASNQGCQDGSQAARLALARS